MDIISTGCKDFKLTVSPPSGVENLSHLIPNPSQILIIFVSSGLNGDLLIT